MSTDLYEDIRYSRTAILFRTHQFDATIAAYLERLTKETNLPVFVVIDNSKSEIQISDSFQKIMISSDELKSLNILHLDGWGWRCGDYFLIMARSVLRDYDYFWMIEPDLHVDFENLGDFFNLFPSSDGVDLWAAELRTDDPSWYWHRSMEKYYDGKTARCFFPILRISARLIDEIATFRRDITAKLNIDDSAGSVTLPNDEFPNDEVVTATIAHTKGFVARDINFSQHFYTANTLRYGWPYSLRQISATRASGMIYHPVLSGDPYLSRIKYFLNHDNQTDKSFDYILFHYSKPELIEAIVLESGAEGLRTFVSERDHILESVARRNASSSRDIVVAKVWQGSDPFIGLSVEGLVADNQGWQSHHRYLSGEINRLKPKVVVEVGVWKGLSSIFMAKKLQEEKIDGVIISIDTWLGSWDHWESQEWFKHLKVRNGYPSIYNTFVANVVENKVEKFIVPLPLDSVNAAHVLNYHGIVADMIHIDAGHDYRSVMNDLETWWLLLRAGGSLVGDDYNDDGSWPDVRRAFDDFRRVTPHSSFEFEGGKCVLRKPTD